MLRFRLSSYDHHVGLVPSALLPLDYLWHTFRGPLPNSPVTPEFLLDDVSSLHGMSPSPARHLVQGNGEHIHYICHDRRWCRQGQ